MNRARQLGLRVPILGVLALSACAAPVPNAFVSASHETIATALPVSGAATSLEQQTLDLARQFVLRVRNTECGVLGTGFFAKGLLFTNRHVAAGATSLELSNWAGEDFTTSVVGHSGNLDLARMAGGVPADVTPASIGASDPYVGEPVYVAGYPEGNQLTVSSGDVLATLPGSRFGMSGQILLVSDQVKPGNSGSPLLDPDGKVVGVVFAENVDTHDAFVIPVSSLTRFLSGRIDSAPLACTSAGAAASTAGRAWS